METFAKVWSDTQSLLLKSANQRTAMAEKVMRAVVTPLQELHHQAEVSSAEIKKEERRVTGQMQVARNKLKTAYKKCQTTLKQMSRAAELEENDPKQKDGHKTFKGLMAKAKAKAQELSGKDAKHMQVKASKEAEAYKAVIVEANARNKTYLKTDLPKVLSAMEKVERRRLDTLRVTLTKYAGIQADAAREHLGLTREIEASAARLDTNTDVANFVKYLLAANGPPPEPVAFTYELPCSPEDIKAGRLEGHPNSVFRASLDAIMRMQEEEHPSLKTPYIVSFMLDAVRKRGGTKAEGIFRISAKKEEVDNLMEQVEQGEYSLSSDSPHLPASLFKQWLRMLADPLVPHELYHEAIESIKVPDADPKAIMNIFKRGDRIAVAVVEQMAELCREIVANEPVNRMTYENLAIVFAPSFFRNQSEDPIELLANTKYETRFTTVLLKAMAEGLE